MTIPLCRGIVGCGWIAGYVALFAWHNRCIRLLACWFRSPSHAESFASRYRIPHAYAEFETISRMGERDQLPNGRTCGKIGPVVSPWED